MLTKISVAFYPCWLAQLVISAALADPLPKALNEQELSERLKSYQSIQELHVTFDQKKHLAEMNLDLPSSGRIVVRRPDQVTWEVLKPAYVRVNINSQHVQIVSGEGAHAKTQVFKAAELGGSEQAKWMARLLPWLLLDARALSKQYTVSLIREGQLQFLPRETKGPFAKLEIELNKAGHMGRLVLFEPSKDTLEIRFGRPRIVRRGL